VRLLPYRRFAIETALPPAEVQARLRDAVEPRKSLRWPSGDHKAFEGEVRASGFELERIIDYRNSFLPRVRGTITPSTRGTRLAGTMRLHDVVAAFMIIWLTAVGGACLLFVPHAASAGSLEPAALIPLGMLVVGLVLPVAAFIPEARKARRLLAELVEGEDMPVP
jgi:hypothetical protein